MTGTLRTMKNLIDQLDDLAKDVLRQVHDPASSSYHNMRESMFQLLDVTDSDISVLLNLLETYAGGYKESFQRTTSITRKYLSNARDAVIASTDIVLLYLMTHSNVTRDQYKQIQDIAEDSKQKIALVTNYLQNDFTRRLNPTYTSLDPHWFSLFHEPSDEHFCLDLKPSFLRHFHESYLQFVDFILTSDPFEFYCETGSCENNYTDSVDPQYAMMFLYPSGIWEIDIQLSSYIDDINMLSTCLYEFEHFLYDALTMLSMDSKPKRWHFSYINVTTISHYQLQLTRLYNGYANGEYSKSALNNMVSADLKVGLISYMDSLRSEIKDVLTDPVLASASSITKYVTDTYSTAILATWLLSTYINVEKLQSAMLTRIFDMNIWRQPLGNEANGLLYEEKPNSFPIPEDVEDFVQNDMVMSLNNILNRYVLNMKEVVTSSDISLRQLTYNIERDIEEIERELFSIVADTDFTQYSRLV